MKPASSGPTLADLRARREEILRIAAAYGASNVRVFGSVARGDAQADSDIDLLVDIVADAKGFAYFGVVEDLQHALARALGKDVDVVDSAALRRMRERVLKEAVPV
ncbi:MAG: nucleotidyltransferase family protein [Dehalococcoidia bacterium]